MNQALDIQQTVDFFKPAYQQLAQDLAQYLAPAELEQLQQKQASFVEQGVPEDVAQYLSQLSTLFSVMAAHLDPAHKRGRLVPQGSQRLATQAEHLVGIDHEVPVGITQVQGRIASGGKVVHPGEGTIS